MTHRAFIIPGRSARPKDLWYMGLGRELSDRGVDAHVVAMPKHNFPILSEWVDTIAQEVGQADAHTYLIGHSQGAISILSYVSQLEGNGSIGGVLLVAPPLRISRRTVERGTDAKLCGSIFPDFLRDFIYHKALRNTRMWNQSAKIDWDSARKNCGKYFALFSTNDKFVGDYREPSNTIEEMLDARIKVETNAGHFRRYTPGEGFFPTLLHETLLMLGQEYVAPTPVYAESQ